MTNPKPFAANIHFGPNCWEWMSGLDSHGYGQYKTGGVKYIAHRYAFMIANGPIPDGMFVCHTCDNPKCVRRDHLFLGTAADNMADKCAKGRHSESRVTHCPKGHGYTESNTGFRNSGLGSRGRYCRTCDRERCTTYRNARA